MALESIKVVKIGTLTIASGQQRSNALSADVFGKYDALSINAPAALDGTVNIEAYPDDPASGTPNDVQSPPGTEINIAAAKSIVLTSFPFPHLCLFQSVAAASDRVFTVWAQLHSTSSR